MFTKGFDKTASSETNKDKDVGGLEKTALNALKARRLASSYGLLPEGQWKWALRNLRKGKTPEELGAFPEKHIQTLLKQKSAHKKGIEVGMELGKKKLLGKGLLKGIYGGLPASGSKTIPTKTVHTHPYSGLFGGSKKDFSEKMWSTVKKTTGKKVDEILKAVMTPSVNQTYRKGRKFVKRLEHEPHLAVHPTGLDRSLAASDLGDAAAWKRQAPLGHHTILDPNNNLLGVHKLREKLPDGLRSFYLDKKRKA